MMYVFDVVFWCVVYDDVVKVIVFVGVGKYFLVGYDIGMLGCDIYELFECVLLWYDYVDKVGGEFFYVCE